MLTTINLQEKFSQVKEYWTPKIISELNGQHIKIAKLKGDFIWHSHKEEDELFMIIKGILYLDFKGYTKTIAEGEMINVPKGIEHRPRTNEKEVWVLLFEPATIKHTGEIVNERTQTNLEWI